MPATGSLVFLQHHKQDGTVVERVSSCLFSVSNSLHGWDNGKMPAAHIIGSSRRTRCYNAL